MAGIKCRCNNYFSTDSFPSPYGFRMFSESDYDQIEDPVNRRSLENLFLNSAEVYKCPVCNRLILVNRKDNSLTFFINEGEKEEIVK